MYQLLGQKMKIVAQDVAEYLKRMVLIPTNKEKNQFQKIIRCRLQTGTLSLVIAVSHTNTFSL